MSWLVPRVNLTADQLKAVMADEFTHQIVCGGPGAGKTIILMHRAASLMHKHKLKPNAIRIFTFTKALCNFIDEAANMLDIPSDCISTFDQWCHDYMKYRMKKAIPYKEKKPDYDTIRASVRQDVTSKFTKEFDIILIDEAHDLSEDALFIARSISHHVTLFADPSQQIYDNGTSIARIREIFDISTPNLIMMDIFRTSPFVAELAIALMENSSNKSDFLKCVRAEQIERQKPLFYRAIDMKDEQSYLAEKIEGRLKIGDSVAVLFPQKRIAFGWAEAMSELGIEVEDPDSIDMTSEHPKFLTIHSAKGLTFDSVFMPKMTNGAFKQVNVSRQRNMLFVGITRARKWVCLSSTGNEIEPLRQLFRNASSAFTTQEPKDRNRQTLFTTDHPESLIDHEDKNDATDFL